MQIQKEKSTPMAAGDFAAWEAEAAAARGWSGRERARRLGAADNSMKAWRERGAPHYVGLACAALLAGLAAYGEEKR